MRGVIVLGRWYPAGNIGTVDLSVLSDGVKSRLIVILFDSRITFGRTTRVYTVYFRRRGG